MVMFLLMSFVFGFGMASTMLIGQAFGRKDVDGARRVVGTAVGSFLLVAIGDRDCRLVLRAGDPEAARHARRARRRSRSLICA